MARQTTFLNNEAVLHSLIQNGAQWPADVQRLNPNISIRSIVRAFQRLYADERIRLTKFGFKANAKYRTYRHSKRLIDTHSKNPQNRWDSAKMDLELTCEGLAPIGASHNVVDSVVNPKMVAAALSELANNGILLVSGMRPGESAFGYNEWKVVGGEWLDTLAEKWERYWAVEIELINNVGKRYTFHTRFSVRVKDFVGDDDE